MTGRWFRFYDSVVDDPKVQRLSLPSFRLWVNILCLASRNGGKLPSLVDMTFSLRMTEKQVVDGLESLEKAGLVDAEVDGVSTPHNWNGRQFKADVSTERVKRFRERQPKRDETVSCNVPEQIQSRADTEQIETTSLRSVVPPEPVTVPLSLVPKPDELDPPPFLIRPQPKRHRMPDEFDPRRESALAYWHEKGRDDLCAEIEHQVTLFKAHHRKLGSRMEHWDSAWVTWYSRAPEMTRAPSASRLQPTPILSIL